MQHKHDAHDQTLYFIAVHKTEPYMEKFLINIYPPRPILFIPGQLSLAIPPWVGTMSTGNGFGHHQGRNSEFCVTVGPVTRLSLIHI